MRKFSLYVLLLSVVALAVTLGTPSKVQSQYSSPVHVLRDDENPARHSFQTTCNAPGDNQYEQSCQIVVPAGQMLVIEYVSVRLMARPGAKLQFLQLETVANGHGVRHNLNLPSLFEETTGTYQYNTDAYQLGQALRVYADPSSSIYLIYNFDGGATTTAYLLNSQFTLSGYTVSVP